MVVWSPKPSPRASKPPIVPGTGDESGWSTPQAPTIEARPPSLSQPIAPAADTDKQSVQGLLAAVSQAYVQEIGALQVQIYKLRASLAQARSQQGAGGTESPPIATPPSATPQLLKETESENLSSITGSRDTAAEIPTKVDVTLKVIEDVKPGAQEPEQEADNSASIVPSILSKKEPEGENDSTDGRTSPQRPATAGKMSVPKDSPRLVEGDSDNDDISVVAKQASEEEMPKPPPGRRRASFALPEGLALPGVLPSDEEEIPQQRGSFRLARETSESEPHDDQERSEADDEGSPSRARRVSSRRQVSGNQERRNRTLRSSLSDGNGLTGKRVSGNSMMRAHSEIHPQGRQSLDSSSPSPPQSGRARLGTGTSSHSNSPNSIFAGRSQWEDGERKRGGILQRPEERSRGSWGSLPPPDSPAYDSEGVVRSKPRRSATIQRESHLLYDDNLGLPMRNPSGHSESELSAAAQEAAQAANLAANAAAAAAAAAQASSFWHHKRSTMSLPSLGGGQEGQESGGVARSFSKSSWQVSENGGATSSYSGWIDGEQGNKSAGFSMGLPNMDGGPGSIGIRREWLHGGGWGGPGFSKARAHASRTMSTKLALSAGELPNHEKQKVILYNGAFGNIIHKPDRPLRIAWEALGAFFIAFDLIVVPVTIIFQPTEGWFGLGMDWLTLIYWTLNIPATFLVGVVKDGILIMVPSQIAWNYVRTWLTIDLLVVVPDWIFTILRILWDAEKGGGGGDYTKLLRVVRLTRTLRLLRLLKLKWILEVLNDMLETEYMSVVANIVRKIIVLMVLCHYIACGWFLLAMLRDDEFDTWVKVHDFNKSHWFYQYITSFHWAITQFTPASMHVQPQNVYERTFNVIVVLFALVAFSYVVGSISASLSQLRALKEDVAKQFWSVRKYMRQNKLPTHLSIRIMRFLEKEHDRQKSRMPASSIRIFSLLSEQLFSEMQCAVCLPNLRAHPLFEHLNKTAETMMQRLALKGISEKLLANEDKLFIPEEKAQCMGVIISGCLRYTKVKKFGDEYDELVDKGEDWIAEQALWCEEWTYLGQCVAVSDCELQNVSVETFVSLVCMFPSQRVLVASYARSYMRMLWESDEDEMVDISKGEDLTYMARDCVNDFNMDFGDQLQDSDSLSPPEEHRNSASVLKRVRALSAGRFELFCTTMTTYNS